MCHVDADNDCLILVDNTEVPALNGLIDTTKFEIELQSNISHILITTTVFHKFGTDRADIVDDKVLVCERLDAPI